MASNNLKPKFNRDDVCAAWYVYANEMKDSDPELSVSIFKRLFAVAYRPDRQTFFGWLRSNPAKILDRLRERGAKPITDDILKIYYQGLGVYGSILVVDYTRESAIEKMRQNYNFDPNEPIEIYRVEEGLELVCSGDC